MESRKARVGRPVCSGWLVRATALAGPIDFLSCRQRNSTGERGRKRRSGTAPLQSDPTPPGRWVQEEIGLGNSALIVAFSSILTIFCIFMLLHIFLQNFVAFPSIYKHFDESC